MAYAPKYDGFGGGQSALASLFEVSIEFGPILPTRAISDFSLLIYFPLSTC